MQKKDIIRRWEGDKWQIILRWDVVSWYYDYLLSRRSSGSAQMSHPRLNRRV